MSAITIRKLPELAKQRLRLRAAAHGRSMEAEARAILLTGIEASESADYSWIESLISAGDELGGVDLVIADDQPAIAADLESA